MTRLLLIVCAALAATLCLSAVSHAHRVNIFAYVDGDTVVTESGYSRTSRVNKGVIEVYDAGSGDMLLSGTTDEQGNYSFKVPDKARKQGLDLRLRLKAGVGHEAEWVVKAEEFGAAVEAQAAPAEVQAAAPAPAAAAPAMDTGAVEAVVKRELEPVKRMLADLSQPGPSVSDIFGGIGYIFGLFGVAAYFKSRK